MATLLISDEVGVKLENLYAENPPLESTTIITSNSLETPTPTTQTTSSSSPQGDPTPLGYLGKYVGEKGYDVRDNGSIEDVYDWDGSKWIFIETRNI